jgi:hypothetical protein
MKSKRSALVLSAIAGLVFVGLCLAVVWVVHSLHRLTDLGSRPVGYVFQQVFLIPMPPGVSDVRVSGMSSLSGEVWMRFRVADVHAFLVTLNRDRAMSFSAPGQSDDEIPSPSEAAHDPYAPGVGWTAVYAVRHPESYSFESDPPGHGWFGEMVVDREQKTVFVHGGLM